MEQVAASILRGHLELSGPVTADELPGFLTQTTLAACYLGGHRFTTLAQAGRVEERRPGVARRADALFAAPRTPWSPFHF